MQCLQCVFYSLLSLIKHRVYVKGHQNNLQTSKIIPHQDPAPPVLKFLDPPLTTSVGYTVLFPYLLIDRVLYFSIHRYEFGKFWPNLRESDYDFIGEGKGMGYNINVPLNQVNITCFMSLKKIKSHTWNCSVCIII